ncbi:MAG TPA: glycosyl hydrolase-related protein, partial [Acidimicrobiales bacterium]|nr:glycosyl hydrolase-related protein [Acidimicrobiales bacterium]
PAEDGDGLVLRVLNPSRASTEVTVELGFAVAGVESVRLDESPDEKPLRLDGSRVVLPVGARALRSLRVRPRGPGSAA